MKKNPVFISAFCSLLFWYSAWAAPLFENGKTQWKIQVPAAPDPVEEYAAEELRDALGKMSGAVFPIIKSDAEARENTIVIGTPATSAAVREISSRLRFNSSEIESLNVITWHGRLYLVGNVVRGSLYAVYCFLNRELGVRWLWPGKEGEFIPRKNRYNLPVLFYAYTPPFRYRSMLNTLGNQDAEIWAARNFMNASSVNLKVRSKAGFHRIYGNHMIGLTKQDRLLHPDYCGLRQGERTGPAGCWSNPGFLKLMTERVSEIIEKYQLEIINPYPADVTGRCECRKCVENKDLSSRWYLFYQKLRDELHKKYPRLRFAGLAYQEYRRPPLKFPPGLEFVEYAQYNRCYVHTLDDPACGINAKSIRELRQWCRLSPMGIYGYAFVLFHPAAYTPFWDMLANAVKTYRDMNLLHIKTEFPVSGPKTARSERIQERQRLPYYMYAQLVWNPDVNIKELVSDFCATVYGPAAQPMTEYHLAMAKAWNLQKAHYSYFLHKPDGASLHFINPELIKTAKQKFSEAKTILERLSGDDSGKTRRLSDLEIDIAAFRQWEKLYQITHEKAVTVSLPQTDSFSKAPVFEMNSRNQMHQKTELRIYYTRDALHLQITCAEKDMQNLRKGTAGHDSSAVFNGDHIEIFLDCQQGYLHFAFTPAGGTYDAFGHDTSYNPSWKPVIHMKKDCWIAEVSLPFKELGAVPVSGDQWQLIVNRNSRPEACGFPLPAYHDISAGAILGETGTRKNIAPISRKDTITIPVGKQAREAYLLLFGINNPAQVRFAQPSRPLRLDDMENFHIEAVYADGTSTKAFPYSVENRAFYISGRTAGVYAAPLDPDRELKEITLHFPSYGIDFYLAALTLGTNGRLLDFVRSVSPTPELAPVFPGAQAAGISLSNHLLKIGKYDIDLKNGLSVKTIPGGKIHPSSGLLLRVNGDFFTGRCFSVAKARIEKGAAEILLQGNVDGIRDLSVMLHIRPGKNGDLIWSGQLQNNGTKPITVSGASGFIRDLKIGNTDQDMIFFPRSRAEISGRNATYRAAYGMEFLHMFFDFFNPQEKRGLMILCDNRDHAKNEYHAAKRDTGLSGYVWLQKEFADLAPGQVRSLPEIRWQPHDGDWHSALLVYRRFLDGFYKPVKAQNKDYFLKTMVNTCYHTTHTLSWSFFRVPPILSKDKSIYHIDELLDFEKRHLGRTPDFVHLWWSYSDDKKRFQYGNWSSEPFYRQAGGLRKFREAIRYFQDVKHIPVSLYTISDRYINADMPSDFPIRKSALTYQNGSPVANETETYTCLNDDSWVDYAVSDLKRLMQETGARILYSDVLSSFNATRCYNPSHGHEIPSNSIKGDIKFISRLRAALPDDVAFWTEYGLPDSASVYSDGFISYYFMELNEHYAPVYDVDDRRNEREFAAPFAAVRYLLPHYKLFALPTGIEAGNKPSQVDSIFFNGEVFHEVTWFLHESNVRKRINRALAIKDQYKDCFLTADPEPRVQTLMGGIYANRFPGKSRTVWTLLNAAPVTRSGTMLTVPHMEGAVYRDLWNGRVLKPEIKDGMALLSLTLPPQGVGAVSRENR